MIVLDHIDARAGERLAQRGEPVLGQPLRLERRARQGPVEYARCVAQSLDAEARPGQRGQDLFGESHVHELDVGVQRGVAEQHVDDLRDVAAHRRDGELDVDVEQAVAMRAPSRDASRNVARDVRVVQRGGGQLDALLEGDAVRHRGNVGGRAANAVGDGNAAHGKMIKGSTGSARVDETIRPCPGRKDVARP